MTATLNYSCRILVDAKNNSVFLVNADAGVSAEVPLKRFQLFHRNIDSRSA